MPAKDRREYFRKYYEAKKEQVSEYYEAHKEERLKQMKEYRNSPRGRAKHLVHSLKRTDAKYGRGECTITPEWIMENIFTSKCIYCGETDWHKLGCDRIDNSLAHTPENVVCSCWNCNNKRGTIPFEEFVQRLKDGEPLLKKNVPDCSKPVVAKDPITLKVVYEFPSVNEAERNGYKRSAVSAACNGRFNRKGNHRYKGLLWFWA